MTAINVSMGIILNSEGKILIAQRNFQKNFGGMWEFPGGKLEADESPEEALIRELKEELSIDVEVLRSFPPYDYRDESIEVSFYPIQCKIVDGMIVNNEHEEVKFISIDDIDNFDFAPPDYKTVDLVKENYQKMVHEVLLDMKYMAQNEQSKIKLKDKIANVINSSYAETIAMEADILINSRRTTNPDIENAHKIAFPNHDISFSEHVSSFDTIEQKMGVISGVKGKLFEIKVKDHLQNEFDSEGLNVELAEDVNQKGWDIVVKDQNNEPLQYFQVKCSNNIDYITSSTEKYPEFVHIVPEDIYTSSENLIKNHNIQSAPYTLEDLDSSVDNAHNFVGSIGELFVPPVVTLGLIIISELTQKPDIDRAAKRISISGSAAAIGSVASIMTNTWWIGALMGLGIRHYLYKEFTPTDEDKHNSRKKIIANLKHLAEVKELSKTIQLLEIYRYDIPKVKIKAAEKTVEMFFKAIEQPDHRYILKRFSKLSINRIGKERLISYLENIKHTFGKIISREGPIYKEYKKIKKDGIESVVIYLKYKTKYQHGEFIETVLVIDKPWGIATYNISSGDIKSIS